MNIEHDRPRAADVITAYNDEAHIERAIQSACNQTERSIEIISFDAKKMIVCQLIKAVHVGRGYRLTVDLNVSFEALRTFSTPEPVHVNLPEAI